MGASRNKSSADPVLQAVAACVSRSVAAGDTVVVGYSGGLDSTVLLHAAHTLARNGRFELSAIHVHHGLSPNAETWCHFCAETCAALGLPIELVKVEVIPWHGEGIEAGARRVRHKALVDHPGKWKMLAHHADDQAETLVLNLLRGTGVRGAAAIPASHGRILRPFLTISKALLQKYADSHHLVWIEDESNDYCRFSRNYLRANIFPSLSARFPNAVAQLSAAAGRFGEASSLLDDLARLDLAGRPATFPMPLALLRELPEPRVRNLLRAMLSWQGMQSPDEARLKEFVRQLRSAGPGRKPRLDLVVYSLWCEAGLLSFRPGTQDSAVSGSVPNN